MQIFVKTITGKALTMDVSETDTLGALKKKVYDKMGIPVDQQKILYTGQTLNDDKKTMKDYSIAKESTVFLVPVLKGGKLITVNVRTITSTKAQPVVIESTGKVSDLKKKIHEKIGMPEKQQKLLIAGVALKDETSLEAAGVKDGVLVCVIYILK